MDKYELIKDALNSLKGTKCITTYNDLAYYLARNTSPYGTPKEWDKLANNSSQAIGSFIKKYYKTEESPQDFRVLCNDLTIHSKCPNQKERLLKAGINIDELGNRDLQKLKYNVDKFPQTLFRKRGLVLDLENKKISFREKGCSYDFLKEIKPIRLLKLLLSRKNDENDGVVTHKEIYMFLNQTNNIEDHIKETIFFFSRDAIRELRNFLREKVKISEFHIKDLIKSIKGKGYKI